MKRMRVLFSSILLLCFFPYWRALDYQLVFWPSSLFYTLSLVSGMLLFILLPVRILFPEIHKRWLFLGLLVAAVLIWSGSPLSGKAVRHHELRQCGLSTFAGFFYPLMSILPPAHQSDIEARNQMCWIRKMITRAPENIQNVTELQLYLNLLRQNLLSPPRKYKSSLPLIGILHGYISASLMGPALESVEVGDLFVKSLFFWKGQYTVEISEIEYPWYAWPHSAWVKWEYGIIEKNWEAIVNGIEIQSN